MCPLPRLKDGLLYYRRWRWRLFRYDAMLSEDIVPFDMEISSQKICEGGGVEIIISFSIQNSPRK
jgi:hypothetical protein